MSDVAVEHDLRERLGPARDQCARPTCLAFAVSDNHAAVRDGWNPLSCEYLYYHAIKRDGANLQCAVSIDSVLLAVEHDGQPEEIGWPYLTSDPEDVSIWKPPKDVGAVFRRAGEMCQPAFDEACSLVAAGRPATIAMALSDAFYTPGERGIIDSEEPADLARRHAVLVVASGRTPSSRFLLVRNSWGEEWGFDGHAWLSERYLAARIIAVLAMKE